MTFKNLLKSLDWTLIAAAVLLILVNFAMLLSGARFTQALSGLFARQAIAAGIGFIVLIFAARIPFHVWKRYAMPLYILSLGGLIVVALLGNVIRGTVSRLQLFGVQIQPSEFAKIGLVIALAWFLSRYRHIRWRQIVTSALLAAVPIILVIAEPDIGVAVIMLALWGGLVVFQGLPARRLLVLAAVALVVAVGAWNWLLVDYQKSRIQTFLHPASDPLAEGYNVNQSIIALGSGRLLGRGLGQGPQSQLKFLPERHTDFILASIGEEMGFIGVAVVFTLYAIILWRLLAISRMTQDTFGQLIAVGAFLLLLTSFTINAGMNMGLLPVTGIPLPLVSYGGSNLVATLILIGLVQSVSVYSHFLRRPPAEISSFN